MKKRLIAIFLLVTMLFTQLIPVEVMATVGNQLNTAVNTAKEKNTLENPFMDNQWTRIPMMEKKNQPLY